MDNQRWIAANTPPTCSIGEAVEVRVAAMSDGKLNNYGALYLNEVMLTDPDEATDEFKATGFFDFSNQSEQLTPFIDVRYWQPLDPVPDL